MALRTKKLKLSTGISLVWISLLAAFSAQAQPGQIVPPTPNAMKMTEFHAQRPNMYTGTANISIPLYTIDFDGMQLPLSISYNATGVRTGEEASEVGLGWSLSATGVISRTVNGSDDLFPGNGLGPIGYVYATPVTFNLGYTLTQELLGTFPSTTSYYYHLSNSQDDTQPDVFNFNFFGNSGSFTLTQKQTQSDGVIKAVKITQNASAIAFDEANMKFTVISPDGFKGEFSVLEKSTTFGSQSPLSWTDVANKGGWGENYTDHLTSKNQGRLRTITSWYLSKITSPRGQVINFTYDLNANGSSSYVSNSRSYGEVSGITSPPSASQTVHEHVYLKSINSEEVNVQFAMETREDLRVNQVFTPASSVVYFPTGQLLKRFKTITITGTDPASTLNKVINFKQSYFNGGFQDLVSGNQTDQELYYLRSRLDQVTIDDQVYKFHYDNGLAGVPHKLTMGVDHFGFYNGMDNNTILLPPQAQLTYGSTGYVPADTLPDYYYQRPERAVNFNYSKAGLLTKVTYPTHGYTQFSYEEHHYAPPSFNPLPPRTSPRFFEIMLNGNPYPSGSGARVYDISDFDYSGQLVSSKQYKYVVDPANGTSASTGKLMTPLYTRYAEIYHEGDTSLQNHHAFNWLYKSYSSIPGNSSAEGKIIGYSKVFEVVTGTSDSYKNAYYFENRTNQVMKYSSLATGYPNLNGQATQIRNYNSTGQIVQATINSDYYHPLDSIQGIVLERRPGNGYWLAYYALYGIRKSFNTPFKITTIVPGVPGNVSDADLDNYALTGIPNSSIQTNAFTTVKTLTYNSFYLLKTEAVSNSLGETLTNYHIRPGDYSNNAYTLNYMTGPTVNMVNPIIEEYQTKNTVKVFGTANRFVYDAPSNRVNLVATFEFNRDSVDVPGISNGYNFSPAYVMKTIFTQYDPTSGKLLEYRSVDGLTHSFMWGYNNKLPIVHAVGVSYNQLAAAYATAITNPITFETVLRTHTNTSGRQLTTYKHNPLVGITSMVDPTGIVTSYQYDQYARLRLARDQNGAILAQNTYHFYQAQPSRIVAFSGSLDFGTLTPYMYSAKFIQSYVRCSDGLLVKYLTISNTGEDDLLITAVNYPQGFYSSYHGGLVPAGESVPVPVYFDNTVSLQNYSGNITISSNQTGGPTTWPVHALYAANNTNGSYTVPATVDFGNVTSSFNSLNFNITNNGNTIVKIAAVMFNWDGVSNIQNNTDPNFQITANIQCFGGAYFGATLTQQIVFTPHALGQVSTDVTILFEDSTHITFHLVGTKVNLPQG